jgi:ABC-type phosphate transport system substrate-binding protein
MTTTIAGVTLAGLLAAGVPPASAASFSPVAGAGTAGSTNALNQWSSTLQPFGLTMVYQGSGTTNGLRFFGDRFVDFAVTETPFGVDVPGPTWEHAYVPLHGTALSFAYNLSVNGVPVTGLRLSPTLAARIFTRDLPFWDDPALAAENPGVRLPHTPVTPVVLSGLNGSTRQLTSWLAEVAPGRWDAWCVAAGLSAPCGAQSAFPMPADAPFLAQNDSVGAAARVALPTSDGMITYVEHTHALSNRLSEAKLLNDAGWYASPAPGPASVALLADGTVTDPDDGSMPATARAWHATDRRAYPLSYATYLVVPTATTGDFSPFKGRALVEAGRYAACAGQGVLPDLGYALLPPRSTAVALQRLDTVRGADPTPAVTLSTCASPAIGPGLSTPFVDAVPQPAACDKAGSVPCGVTLPPKADPKDDDDRDDDHGHGKHKKKHKKRGGHDDAAERARHGRGEH